MDDQKDGDRKKQVRREGGEELGDWLDSRLTFGCSPTATPVGTQIAEASAIKIATRSNVRAPLPAAIVMSSNKSVDRAYRPSSHKT